MGRLEIIYCDVCGKKFDDLDKSWTEINITGFRIGECYTAFGDDDEYDDLGEAIPEVQDAHVCSKDCFQKLTEIYYAQSVKHNIEIVEKLRDLQEQEKVGTFFPNGEVE